jgi:hypothetical protein
MISNHAIWMHTQQAPGSSRGAVRIVREVETRSSQLQQSRSKNMSRKSSRKSSKFNICGPPSELRAITFRQDLLEWTGDNLTPNLIKALRPEPMLYQEVLDIFYSHRIYPISERNYGEVSSIPQAVLKRVLSVDLCYG